LPAGELARAPPGDARPQVHALERLAHELLAVLRAGSVVNAPDLEQRGVDGHARVERRVGVLEDHLHATAQLAQLPATCCQNVGAVELDCTGIGLDQPDDAARKRRLATPGLAREPEDLAAAQLQRDVVDRAVRVGGSARDALGGRPAQPELLHQPLYAQQRHLVGHRCAPARAGALPAPAKGRTGQAVS
jgi:hypothetical protein